MREQEFPRGVHVRYRPGTGTYGYEDCLEDDGRLAGTVVGYTPTRIRVELTMTRRSMPSRRLLVTRAVDAASLERVHG